MKIEKLASPHLNAVAKLAYDNYIWAIFDNKNPVSFIQLESDGENFITECDSMMNITGAYTQLLSYVMSFLHENKYHYCGVDFESSNIIGINFWLKYFNAYTYSVVRRLDERILPNKSK